MPKVEWYAQLDNKDLIDCVSETDAYMKVIACGHGMVFCFTTNETGDEQSCEMFLVVKKPIGVKSSKTA